jgi:hypothetical protein
LEEALSEPQFVDPEVSRRKFNREVKEFRSQADVYGKRGWFLVLADFPNAFVILATPNTQPVALLFGVWFDFSNYDAAPPSVRLVNPLTREPYKYSEVPTKLQRMLPPPEVGDAVLPLPPNIAGALSQDVPQPQLQLKMAQPLLQANGDDEVPFLCIPGVREYHEHPAHSGDPWELHRTSGEGRLNQLIQVISKYGSETISGFEVQMSPLVRFHFQEPPE